MAYLKRGFTETELRQRWRDEAPSLSPDQIIERFGKPPYRWLGETVPSAPLNDTPTYVQQGRPLLVDENGRQYTPLGSDDPMAANIRLPMSITTQQRSPRSAVPASQLQAFPRIGETVTLVPYRPTASSSSTTTTTTTTQRSWRVRVRGVENSRAATARVLFHQPLPKRQDIESSSVAAQRDRAMSQRISTTAAAAAASVAATPHPHRHFAHSTNGTAEGRALRRFLAMETATASGGGSGGYYRRVETDDSTTLAAEEAFSGDGGGGGGMPAPRKRNAQLMMGV